jgi:ribosomal protein L11
VDNFNNITNNLPSYFLVKVIIIIFESKTFNFQIKKPTTSALINLLKTSKKINDKEYYFIKLKDLIQIAIFKFPNLNLKNAISII